MRNIVKEIERAAAGHAIDWKSSYRDLVMKIHERNARKQGLCVSSYYGFNAVPSCLMILIF